MDDYQRLLILVGLVSFVLAHVAAFLFVRRMLRKGREQAERAGDRGARR
jgi:hypothetical protein